jgi:hypothetical protein
VAVLFLLRFLFALEVERELARKHPAAKLHHIARLRSESRVRSSAPVLTMPQPGSLRQGRYANAASYGAFIKPGKSELKGAQESNGRQNCFS